MRTATASLDEFYRMINWRKAAPRRTALFVRETRDGSDCRGHVGKFSSICSGLDRNTILIPGDDQARVRP